LESALLRSAYVADTCIIESAARNAVCAAGDHEALCRGEVRNESTMGAAWTRFLSLGMSRMRSNPQQHQSEIATMNRVGPVARYLQSSSVDHALLLAPWMAVLIVFHLLEPELYCPLYAFFLCFTVFILPSFLLAVEMLPQLVYRKGQAGSGGALWTIFTTGVLSSVNFYLMLLTLAPEVVLGLVRLWRVLRSESADPRGKWVRETPQDKLSADQVMRGTYFGQLVGLFLVAAYQSMGRQMDHLTTWLVIALCAHPFVVYGLSQEVDESVTTSWPWQTVVNRKRAPLDQYAGLSLTC